MELTIRKLDDEVVFEVDGSLTYKDSALFAEHIEALSVNSPKKVTLDLAGLDYIDSTGLGLFIMISQYGKKFNFTVDVKNARAPVEQILKYSQLTQLFNLVG